MRGTGEKMENKKETEFMSKTNSLMDEIYKITYGKDIFILIAALIPFVKEAINLIDDKDIRNIIVDKTIKQLKEER